MSMSVADAVSTALLPFVSEAVGIAESKLPALLPGLPGALLAEALAIPGVQAEITKLEGKAVDEVIVLLGKGLVALRGEVLAHVHGKLGAWLQKELNAPLPELQLTADQVRAIAKLASEGKLEAALHAAGVL